MKEERLGRVMMRRKKKIWEAGREESGASSSDRLG
eukprot:CAMPEP_0202957302 /NCGR_PEP_ID=MMETSP1396-20130829/1740_1 /ASSEMBLY_ACC=CAM_ASM_000872 /TAXON_ID= /ORGANISM="Pseudokeronopsis sp., Strain Brazil" /LENGTH=34 /DNA_ID= /DNA_START= /DNA_END= /DNA_ORIENTATION=